MQPDGGETRLCRWSGVNALVGGGCVVHTGSEKCLRTIREMWTELEAIKVRDKNMEKDLDIALDLLADFHKEALGVVGSAGDFGYAGSPFERRIIAFLARKGKKIKKATVDNIGF